MSSAPRRVESLVTDKGNVPVYTTTIVEQPWDSYSEQDHATWAFLFRRQREVLQGRACREFIENQQRFGMNPERIPKFEDLNAVLGPATGWKLIGVEGLLPELDFFEHLANRRFPVTWWIRRPDQIDYISEPDMFHDLFGHVPLLLNPVFADYMAAYGRGGVKAHGVSAQALVNLTRLYWYTVEFGLIHPLPGVGGAQPHRFRHEAHHADALSHRHLPENLFRDRQLRAIDGGDAAGFRADLCRARHARGHTRRRSAQHRRHHPARNRRRLGYGRRYLRPA